jgi:hypothetical protein
MEGLDHAEEELEKMESQLHGYKDTMKACFLLFSWVVILGCCS